jgi:hypothetical protein
VYAQRRRGELKKKPQKKEKKVKKNTSLKQKKENKGGDESYTSRRPLQPFWLFFSGLGLSPLGLSFFSFLP